MQADVRARTLLDMLQLTEKTTTPLLTRKRKPTGQAKTRSQTSASPLVRPKKHLTHKRRPARLQSWPRPFPGGTRAHA